MKSLIGNEVDIICTQNFNRIYGINVERHYIQNNISCFTM